MRARATAPQPLQRRLLLRRQRHSRCGVGHDERVEGIPLDAEPFDGDEAQSDEAGHTPSIQSARREIRDRHAVRHAAQGIENGLLPGRQRRAGEIFSPLRRDARDPNRARRVSLPAQRLRKRDQSILLERDDGVVHGA